MKKLSLLIIGFFILLTAPSFAQKKGTLRTTKKATVKFGPEVKAKKTWITSIPGKIDDDYYVIKTERKGMFSVGTQYLDKVNNRMKTVKSVEINSKKIKKAGRYYMGSIITKGHLYLVYNQKAKKRSASSKVTIVEVNKSSLTLSKPKVTLNVKTKNPKAIVSFYGIGLGKKIDELLENGFDVSSDGSKILVYQSKYSVKKTDSEEVMFFVYDEELNELWQKSIVLPYRSDLFSINDVIVDNDGNIHLLGREYKEKRKVRKKGKPNYKYRVISYFEQGEVVKDNTISLGEDFITDVTIALTDKSMVAAGFYSEKGTFSSIKGVFHMKMDLMKQEVVSKSTKEFSIDFMIKDLKKGKAERTKKKAAKGKNVEMYQFDLDEIIMREDGGSVLLAEQFYITTHVRVDSKGNATTYYVYHYNDIIAVSISPDGEIEWANKVPKIQASQAAGGPLSYASAVCKDKVYLVFNDNSKNITAPKTKGGVHKYSGFKSKKSIVSIVELDSDGSMTREVLYKPGKYDIVLMPGISDNSADCELFLYNRRRKIHQYSTMTIKE